MNTTTSIADKIAATKLAIANRASLIAQHRADHERLTTSLADAPDDPTLLDQLVATEQALAMGGAAQEALAAALEKQEASQRAEDEAIRRDAARQRVRALLAAGRERRAALARIQTAGDAFVASVLAFREQGRATGVEMGEVVAMLIPSATDRMYFSQAVLPAACGSARPVAQAVGTVLRKVVDAIGSDAMRSFVAMNDFETTPLTFEMAADRCEDVIQTRLKDYA